MLWQPKQVNDRLDGLFLTLTVSVSPLRRGGTVRGWRRKTGWNHATFFLGCSVCVPQPGMEPAAPALEVWSLNHRTTRQVPGIMQLLSSGIMMVHSQPPPLTVPGPGPFPAGLSSRLSSRSPGRVHIGLYHLGTEDGASLVAQTVTKDGESVNVRGLSSHPLTSINLPPAPLGSEPAQAWGPLGAPSLGPLQDNAQLGGSRLHPSPLVPERD